MTQKNDALSALLYRLAGSLRNAAELLGSIEAAIHDDGSPEQRGKAMQNIDLLHQTLDGLADFTLVISNFCDVSYTIPTNAAVKSVCLEGLRDKLAGNSNDEQKIETSPELF